MDSGNNGRRSLDLAKHGLNQFKTREKMGVVGEKVDCGDMHMGLFLEEIATSLGLCGGRTQSECTWRMANTKYGSTGMVGSRIISESYRSPQREWKILGGLVCRSLIARRRWRFLEVWPSMDARSWRALMGLMAVRGSSSRGM